MGDESLRRDGITEGSFVVVGVAAIAGPPVFGLEGPLVGGALAAYGVVSVVGTRLVDRWGRLGR